MKFAGRNLIYLSNDEYNEIKNLKEKKMILLHHLLFQKKMK